MNVSNGNLGSFRTVNEDVFLDLAFDAKMCSRDVKSVQMYSRDRMSIQNVFYDLNINAALF